MREGNVTRERLLDEATKLVQQKGFGATSVNDMLLAAGIKRGTLYYHFPGKEDLGLELLERAKVTFLASVDEALSAPTPREGLARFFDAVLERHRKKGFTGGCLFGNTVLEMSDTSSPYAESMKRLFSEWTGKIEAVLLTGQQAGDFRSDISAADLAQVIVSTIEGGIMMSRLRKEEGPLKACLDSLQTFVRVNVLGG
jgi:TetR/AcrR family transcriptional repressor of nem operon